MSPGGGTSKVRLGVLGAGNIADLNVAGYLSHEQCDVLAVCDVDATVAKAAAARWGVPRVYTDLDLFLADPELDAIEVLTPTHLHHDHVVAALEAGKHVSCQKPVANSVDEARSMAEAAESAARMFRISECFVHYPPMEKAKALVSEGAIGRPTSIRIKTIVGQTDAPFQAALRPEGYGWRLDRRSPGGHLFDDNVHKYAMALWLLDQDIVSVQAVVRRRDLFFEPCAVIFEYGDPDLLGMMDVNYAPKMWMRSSYYGADEFIEIQGDEGMLWITQATGEMLDLPPVLVYRGDRGNMSTTAYHVDADWGTGFVRASRHFVDCLLAGHQADMTATDATRVLQLCFAVYQASETRSPVDPRQISGTVSPSGWGDW
jgi:predicted dehydrogenase